MGSDLDSQLVDALAAARADAPTSSVSIELPAPLADAYEELAELGLGAVLVDAIGKAVMEALQAVIVGRRLDAIYADQPDARPSEAEVIEMAARAGVELR